MVVKPPQTREQELEAGPGGCVHDRFPVQPAPARQRRLGPAGVTTKAFHALPYAYAVKPGDEAWLRRVDEFVGAIKRDGRLEAAAKRHGLARSWCASSALPVPR